MPSRQSPADSTSLRSYVCFGAITFAGLIVIALTGVTLGILAALTFAVGALVPVPGSAPAFQDPGEGPLIPDTGTAAVLDHVYRAIAAGALPWPLLLVGAAIVLWTWLAVVDVLFWQGNPRWSGRATIALLPVMAGGGLIFVLSQSPLGVGISLAAVGTASLALAATVHATLTRVARLQRHKHPETPRLPPV